MYSASCFVSCLQDNWELKLYVDDRHRALLAGTASISHMNSLTLGVYNRHGWVSHIDDDFSPPETTAYFRELEYVIGESRAHQRLLHVLFIALKSTLYSNCHIKVDVI